MSFSGSSLQKHILIGQAKFSRDPGLKISAPKREGHNVVWKIRNRLTKSKTDSAAKQSEIQT